MIIRRFISRSPLTIAFVMCIATTAQADWQDLWKTPEQRALQAYEDGDVDLLLNEAPDNSWTGLGQFQSQDYKAASQSFETRTEELRATGDTHAINRARYNQGVSEVMAGQFQRAIELFDDVLTDDPAYADAEHNRMIAQELLELQQQQQDNPGENGEQGQEGDQGEQGDAGSENDGQSQQGEQASRQPSEEGQQDESSDASGDERADNNPSQSAQNDTTASGSQRDEATDSVDQGQAERQQDADDAREALAAEAAQQDDLQGDDEASDAPGMNTLNELPLSEAEQATEQLLRRIPDDPAGLLRRKLEQSHRYDYPEVRDAAQPW